MNANHSGQKPKLLVVTSMFPRWKNDSEPGFVFELSRRLIEHFDVRVLAPHAPGAAVRETMDGVEVIRFRYMLEPLQTLAYGGGILPKLRKRPLKWLLVPFFVICQYIASRSQIRQWQPQIIHAHWIIPQGIIAIMARHGRHRPKCIVTSHGGDLFALNGKIFTGIKRFVLKGADAVTVVSNVMRDVMSKMGILPSKIYVEPMGVDLRDLFTPEKSASRSQHQILFVGRLVEKKGLTYLLDAMPKIQAAFPDASLIIAGFGPEEARLRARTKSLEIHNSVKFVGPTAQSALPDLYRRATILVAPFGDQEGFGLVVVEAIGCECPVIVSSIPATRELLSNHPECLVEPRNTEALAARIVDVFRDPEVARATAKSLREEFISRLDWLEVSRRYAALMHDVLARTNIANR